MNLENRIGAHRASRSGEAVAMICESRERARDSDSFHSFLETLTGLNKERTIIMDNIYFERFDNITLYRLEMTRAKINEAAFISTVKNMSLASIFLPKGKMIGLQLQSLDNGYDFYAFGNTESVTKDDIDRICEPDLKVGTDKGYFQKISGYYGERKIYSINVNTADLKEKPRCSEPLQFWKLVHAAVSKRVIIRFAFTGSGNNRTSVMKMLISFPGEISLAGKTLFANVFNNFYLKEVNPEKDRLHGFDSAETEGIIGECFKNFQYACDSFLIESEDFGELIDNEDEYFFDEDDWEDFNGEDPFDDSDSKDRGKESCPIKRSDLDLSIEELELSVRSFNCLMRAGYTKIGDIAGLNEEDLMKIRNLGKKGVDEIQSKLKDFNRSRTEKARRELKKDYFEELDSLIGLSDVKKQVDKITAFARMIKDIRDLNLDNKVPVALNMDFAGNPGTAKTTVARILAGILHELGLLASSEIVEVGRSGLVAKYVGQTADKVRGVFEQADGKLLFIDEAYSLVDSRENDFGDEAINTIVQEMENRRSRTVVVFAGYPDKMKAFFDRNPGLRSRVPFHLEFSDYDAEEMYRIVVKEASSRGFTISDKARDGIVKICKKTIGNPNSGNGRFCRNLVESAIINYAYRIYGGKDIKERTFTLEIEDFEENKLLTGTPKTHQFGFRSKESETPLAQSMAKAS